MNKGELMMAERENSGARSHKIWMAADNGKGSRCNSGRKGLAEVSVQ